MSKTIDNLLSEGLPSEDLLYKLSLLGTQHILQEAIEVEVDESLSRDWYQRSDNQVSTSRGYRNGYTSVSKTISGPITLSRPYIRDNAKPFKSNMLSRIDRLEDRLLKLTTEPIKARLSAITDVDLSCY